MSRGKTPVPRGRAPGPLTNIPVLVDTSVWIDYFRPGSDEVSALVDELLGEDLVRICGIVLGELLQGARSAKEIRALVEVGKTVAHLSEPADIWERAGILGYELRRKGDTVPLADCYLARLTTESGCRLLTRDGHFEAINRFSPVPFVPIA